MDYESLFKAGVVDWWKERALQKWFAVLFVVYFVFHLAIYGAMTLVLDESKWIEEISNPSAGVGQIDDPDISNVLSFFLWIVILLLVFSPVLVILSAFAWRETVQWKVGSSPPMTLARAVGFLVFGIYNALNVWFLWKDKKWLLVPLVSFLGFGAAIWALPVGSIPDDAMHALVLFGGLLVGVLGFLIYLGLVLYHGIRLNFSSVFWVKQEQSMHQSVDDAWNFSKGKMRDILIGFGLLIVAIIAVAIVAGLFSQVGVLFLFAGPNGFWLFAIFNSLVSGLQSSFFVIMVFVWSAEMFVQLSGSK